MQELVRDNYLRFCEELNRIIFEELFCSGDKSKVELWYDKNALIFQELYIPMFKNIIMDLRSGANRIQMEELLYITCNESYGVGDVTRIKNLVDRLMPFQTELISLYQKLKEEYQNCRVTPEQQALSDELDEYLRIGEEVERERTTKKE